MYTLAYDPNRVGYILREQRLNNGLYQTHVRERTGIPRSKISEYENGHTLPCQRNLRKLLDCYETDDTTRKIIFKLYTAEKREKSVFNAR